jgi:predicted ATPase
MPRPLDRVQIRGIKSIREMELTLGPLNVLIGANGAGKSNLIGAFGLLNNIVEARLQVAVARAGGASTLLHYGPKHTSKIELILDFGPNGYAARLSPAAGDTLFFEDERCWFHNEKYPRPYDLPLGSGHRETALPAEARRSPIADHVLAALRSWKVYHFHDTSALAPVKQKGKIDDNTSLRPDAANLAAFLFRLREEDEPAYQRIVGAIRQVAPFFEDFQLRRDPMAPDRIQLEWSELGSERNTSTRTRSPMEPFVSCVFRLCCFNPNRLHSC